GIQDGHVTGVQTRALPIWPQEHRPPSKGTCLSESEHHRSCSCSASSKSRLLDSIILSRIPWPAEAFDGLSTGNQAAPPRRQLLRESTAHYKCLSDLAALVA